MDGRTNPDDHRIRRAYEFFEKRLRLQPEVSMERLYNVIRNSLVLVSIVLDKDDNPYLIFESLNAKGEPLTQADLIRNYFFMKIHVSAQEKVHAELWRPMQERLGSSLTEFIRHFLMKDGRNVKQSDIYYTLKESVEEGPEDQVISYLKEVAAFSKYYAKLLDPEEEKSAKIASRTTRLNRFEATTAYTFLLNVYHDYENGEVAEDDFAVILDILETFLIRRFVCGVPTHGLNRTFASLYAQARKAGSLVDGVRQVLKDKDFPRDKDFRERLVTFRLYGGGDRLPKARLILERLELSFRHKEGIDLSTLTIEHVMPQTPSEWWKQELGDEWEVAHEAWVDTIGNLTMTGYNPELSNSDFPTKKAILQRSHVELNRYFAGVETWDEQAIARRGEELADRAVTIWPDFSGRDDGSGLASAGEEDEQEDVKLLIAKVIEHFGGAVERIGSGNRHIYRVADGKVINVKYSKRHSDYYWYVVHASVWEELAKAGGTHMVLIVGQQGFLTVPVAVVKEYMSEAQVSRKSDGTVRHYHMNVSAEPKLEFFHHGKPGRVPLRPYFTRFES